MSKPHAGMVHARSNMAILTTPKREQLLTFEALLVHLQHQQSHHNSCSGHIMLLCCLMALWLHFSLNSV